MTRSVSPPFDSSWFGRETPPSRAPPPPPPPGRSPLAPPDVPLPPPIPSFRSPRPPLPSPPDSRPPRFSWTPLPSATRALASRGRLRTAPPPCARRSARSRSSRSRTPRPPTRRQNRAWAWARPRSPSSTRSPRRGGRTTPRRARARRERTGGELLYKGDAVGSVSGLGAARRSRVVVARDAAGDAYLLIVNGAVGAPAGGRVGVALSGRALAAARVARTRSRRPRGSSTRAARRARRTSARARWCPARATTASRSIPGTAARRCAGRGRPRGRRAP